MKRMMSFMLAVCMLMSFTTAFAENNLNAENNSDIINTEALTDENVLYKAIQNKNSGFSFFGLNDDSGEEITADFDVVLGLDMSADMYDFDYNGEMAWTDNFTNLSEQVPEGTRFAVVTDEPGECAEGLTLDKSSLNYSGESNIIALLDNCLNTFDGTADNNVVIATAAKVDDVQAFSDKMDELRDYGVIPFVFVLNTETNSGLDDIDGVYQCASELELRLNMSDLYLSFVEFNSMAIASETALTSYAVASADEATDEEAVIGQKKMPNDYKSGKHKFGNLDKPGEALISVLNMYGCVPLMATVGDSYYDLFELHDETALLNFLKNDNVTFSKDNYSALTDMVETWDALFEIIRPQYASETDTNTIIEKNIKRRFPVFKYTCDENTNTISNISIVDTKASVADGEYVFDTYKYLMDTIAYSSVLYDTVEYAYKEPEEVTTAKNGVTITTTYPSSYTITVNEESENTVRKEALDSGIVEDIEHKPIKCYNVGDHQLKTVAAYQRKFVIGSMTTYNNDGMPNILNVNKIYYTRLYTDIKDGHWAKDYIFNTTNKGVVKGMTDNTFLPDGNLTRCQFMVMLLRSIGVADIDTVDTVRDGVHWAAKYMELAEKYELLLNKDYEDTTHWDDPITREEAAYMASQMFIKHMSDIEVPTNIYDYLPDGKDYTDMASYTAYKDEKDIDNVYKTAVYQMTFNNVINGYSDGFFAPKPKSGQDENSMYGRLTRAEGCKIISKCLFTLDDNTPTILTNIEYTTTPIDLYVTADGRDIDDISFGVNNTVTYNVEIERPENIEDTDYRYMIEVYGDTENITTNVSINSNEQSPVSDDMKNVFIIGKGIENVTVKIKKNDGNPTVGLRIMPINAPQEVVFEQQKIDENGTPHYYIYDDNHEHVEIYDLADNPTHYYDAENFCAGCSKCRYEDENDCICEHPKSISHNADLGEGIYTIFSYHNVGESLRGNMGNGNTQLYTDCVIYPAYGYDEAQIEIHSIGYSSAWEWNQPWADYSNTEADDKKPINHSKKDITLNRDLKNKNPDRFWMSELLDNAHTAATNVNDGIWIIMEFEVKKGKVNCDTVAYENDKDKINPYTLEAGKYVNWGDIQFKGISNGGNQLNANEMDFLIDNDVSGNLKFEISNDILTQINDSFTTNTSPFTFNNYTHTPGSVGLRYEYNDGIKITKYGSNVNDDKKEHNWIFENGRSIVRWDGDFTRLENTIINALQIPEPNGPGYSKEKATTFAQSALNLHSRREFFNPNQELTNEIVESEDMIGYLQCLQEWVLCKSVDFGVKYLYKININNLGGDRKINYMITSEGHVLSRYGRSLEELKSNSYKFKKEDTKEQFLMHSVDIHHGKNTFYVETAMTTGCNYTINNVFVIE